MDKNRFFNHVMQMHLISDCFASEELKLHLDCKTFTLTVANEEKAFSLYPHFIELSEQSFIYANEPSENAQMFAGWRPYWPVSIPLFSNKIAFKNFLLEHNLPTPKFSSNKGDFSCEYVIKAKTSSFGQGLSGPYRPGSQHTPQSLNNLFLEQFIQGDILKVWYWCDTLVCLERLPMPAITGDGEKPIAVLLDEISEKRWIKPKDWCSAIEQVLSFYGLNLDEVLPYGKNQIVDIRYGSPVSDPFLTKDHLNIDGRLAEEFPVLEAIGKLLFPQIQAFQPIMAYSVDAIIAHDNTLWILEANSNPFIHPELYQYMIRSLLNLDHTSMRLPGHTQGKAGFF